MTPDPHTPPLKSTEPPEIQSAPAIPNAAPAAVTAEESTVAAVTGHSAPLPPAPEPGTPKTPTATPDRLAPAPSAPLVWRVETDDFILTIERPQPGPYPAPTSAGGENQEHVHLVVPGDTLWHIARRYLGDPFRYAELAKLSRIKNPDLIYPGDIVRIQKKKIPAP
jgi:nucleoid-associated protein YgaU